MIMLVMGILFMSATANAIEVPDAIENAFKQKFPNAKKVKWEKENKTEYEASFMLDNKEMSAVYNSDGSLKEIETEIAVTELPKAVSDALNKNYPNAKVHEAAKIERSDNSVVYEAEIKVNGKKTDVLFDPNGNQTK